MAWMFGRLRRGIGINSVHFLGVVTSVVRLYRDPKYSSFYLQCPHPLDVRSEFQQDAPRTFVVSFSPGFDETACSLLP